MDNIQDYDCIIGIDPGRNGGLAVCTDNHISAVRMPENLVQIGDFLKHYIDTYGRVIVFLEKLSIRQDDLQGGKVFRIRKMIANQEQLKAIIALHGLPYVEVHPLTWQSRLGLRIVGEQKSDRKRRYKEEASRLYPQVKVTMANCDALLIMRFGTEILSSTTRKDVRWLSSNIVLDKSNDIYKNII